MGRSHQRVLRSRRTVRCDPRRQQTPQRSTRLFTGNISFLVSCGEYLCSREFGVFVILATECIGLCTSRQFCTPSQPMTQLRMPFAVAQPWLGDKNFYARSTAAAVRPVLQGIIDFVREQSSYNYLNPFQ